VLGYPQSLVGVPGLGGAEDAAPVGDERLGRAVLLDGSPSPRPSRRSLRGRP
jgi:hypothetical protein